LYALHEIGAAWELAGAARHYFSEEEWSTLEAALGPTPTSIAS
jgi:hypothetical protein